MMKRKRGRPKMPRGKARGGYISARLLPDEEKQIREAIKLIRQDQVRLAARGIGGSGQGGLTDVLSTTGRTEQGAPIKFRPEAFYLPRPVGRGQAIPPPFWGRPRLIYAYRRKILHFGNSWSRAPG